MNMEIIELAKKISGRYDALSNEIRVLIIAIIKAYSKAKWIQIRDILEEIIGKRVNPNIIAFHLRRLMESGYIEKEEDFYMINQQIFDIEDDKLDKLVSAIREMSR